MARQFHSRKKDAQHLPSDQNRWRRAAFNRLQNTNSSLEHAEKFANNSTKAAIHRRMRQKDKKGLPG
jgi:hypothetical protein